MKLSLSSIINATKKQVSCDLAGEAVILNVSSGEYFGLNELGARIWNLIQEPRTVGELFEIVLGEYEVTPDQLERDLSSLFEEMATKELIEVQK